MIGGVSFRQPRRIGRVFTALLAASIFLTSCVHTMSKLTTQDLRASANAICSSDTPNFKFNLKLSTSPSQIVRDKSDVLTFSQWHYVDGLEYQRIRALAVQYKRVRTARTTVRLLDALVKTWRVYLGEVAVAESELKLLTSGPQSGLSQNRLIATLRHGGELLTDEERAVWIPMGSLFRSC
jgi:hypothetical protein